MESIHDPLNGLWPFIRCVGCFFFNSPWYRLSLRDLCLGLCLFLVHPPHLLFAHRDGSLILALQNHHSVLLCLHHIQTVVRCFCATILPLPKMAKAYRFHGDNGLQLFNYNLRPHARVPFCPCLYLSGLAVKIGILRFVISFLFGHNITSCLQNMLSLCTFIL